MRSTPLFWFSTQTYAQDFPPLELALSDPDGLLAAGGDLSVARLMEAYRRGIFPWYSDGQPLLWWSPDPRTVLRPDRVRISRSLRRRIQRGDFQVTYDRDFQGVLIGCATARRDGGGTWITRDMSAAYQALYLKGHAHSIECWQDGQLVGGLYGVAIGLVFFGESMFSRRTDASKVALVQLCSWLREWGYVLIDCQVHTDHLASLGAEPIPRKTFASMLENACAVPPGRRAWRPPDEGS
jgi:leucyl/phenylalanyl-tRNA--protein transferase